VTSKFRLTTFLFFWATTRTLIFAQVGGAEGIGPVAGVSVIGDRCDECSDDELSITVQIQILPASVANSGRTPCPQPVRAQIQEIVAAVRSSGQQVDDYAELTSHVLNASGGTKLLHPLRGIVCQNYLVALPPGSSVTRARFVAHDGERSGVCADDRNSVTDHPSWRDCGIGSSGFEGPIIQRFANATVVVGTFLNWSQSNSRRGVFTVNYQPPHNYIHKKSSALPIQVHYATSRNVSDKGVFGGDRNKELSYGHCTVTIPPVHRKGQLESPSWWRLEFVQNPENHVVLNAPNKMDEKVFYSDVRAMAQANGDQALVFIHGYNTSFDDAIKRTAQLKYDLGFRGPVVAFSWPSRGVTAAYTVDEANAEWTVPLFAKFLQSLAIQLGKTRLLLVAHSMGSRVLLNGLKQLQVTQAEISSPMQVVLAAPDVDRDVFVDIAAQIKRKDQTTLYASSTDKALLASKKLHGTPRAGDTADGITIVDGIDTIDVSNVDSGFVGHSYYGDNRSVISDLYYLIRGISIPRFGLKEAVHNGKKYWIFQP
jgi:esterase/lipase superfamily enzyme